MEIKLTMAVDVKPLNKFSEIPENSRQELGNEILRQVKRATTQGSLAEDYEASRLILSIPGLDVKVGWVSIAKEAQ